MKPIFLPNDISGTPSVRPDPSPFILERYVMWSKDSETENKTKKSREHIKKGGQIKCKHTGYEITTNTLTKKITTTKNKTSKTNGILR